MKLSLGENARDAVTLLPSEHPSADLPADEPLMIGRLRCLDPLRSGEFRRRRSSAVSAVERDAS